VCRGGGGCWEVSLPKLSPNVRPGCIAYTGKTEGRNLALEWLEWL